jgi:hypothetical protein
MGCYNKLMLQWAELLQICNIQFTEEKDAIIWQFDSSMRYSVQSLYAVVSDRGVENQVAFQGPHFFGSWLIVKF